LAFSDIVDFPIENSAPTRQIERPKPGDSMEGIIVDAVINSQSIRVRSALQQPGCVFFAARFFGPFPAGFGGREASVHNKTAPADRRSLTPLRAKAYCLVA
jgi:hypothetical protein